MNSTDQLIIVRKILFTIQDYLQNTIDEINKRNFIKSSKLYMIQEQPKNFKCAQWQRFFCSLRNVLSCCEKAFVNLSRMRVPILEVRKRFVC